MTRPACLVLLLLASWLLSLPEMRAAGAPARAAAVAASHDEASAAVRHVAAQSATPQVPRAPLFARLPAPCVAVSAERWGYHDAPTSDTSDRRAALRRVQTRRRVPRLGGGEPPWS